jgi:hypothetical protein
MFGVVMSEAFDRSAVDHLRRPDGQEDICFGLWRPSTGQSRQTAILQSLILPGAGDRDLHGNVSFRPQFLERAMAEAAAAGVGLAMLHSHPMGFGWQDMSPPDIVAERGNAGPVFGATGRPFLGLTLAGQDGGWSARFWERTAPRTYEARWCRCVRVVGERLRPTYHPRLAPIRTPSKKLIRTVSAWGEQCHANITRLRIGLIGAGSTGGFIGESLARSGFEDIVVIDPDEVRDLNLDRLVYSTNEDIGKLKAEVLAARMRLVATSDAFSVRAIATSVQDEGAYRAALDCDVLICCVDRPWGRHVLNHLAYEHMIPVVDGGIMIRTGRRKQLVAADWTAQTVGVGRPCLQCLGQYDAGLVQLERQGMLDDPTYIENLADDHPLKVRQNVFGFSMGCASMQLLQFLNFVVAPLGISNAGQQRYHFVDSVMEPKKYGHCAEHCLMPTLVGIGDDSPYAARL